MEEIFSIRVVIADFYSQKPTRGLDPCYSEFRGKEIKRVPIVRIFGSTPSGQKTCMHVHGVFPYFYIPYEKKDFESLHRAIYQIAMNVDKAINISLGQGSSTAQHVFKVQLVKGVPFYGYHRTEHQYLKIYMFNPRFVRRAANLLQNGAILGKTFNPHESHVPYILQFLIDYNLYGMSFLHVPLEVVKFRRKNNDDDIPFPGIQFTQILSTSIEKKQSTCNLEVDIGSNFILNRFQLATTSNSTHTNPGIESIWHDERIRRKKLTTTAAEDEEKANAVPPLEIPASQERLNVRPTDSEQFYRTALIGKLLVMESSLSGSGSQEDQTLNSTLQSNVDNTTLNMINILSTKDQKHTFNIKKLLTNTVYPEECTQQDNLVNASFIENHLSNVTIFQTSTIESTQANLQFKISGNVLDDDSVFIEDTIVDEELVLSLTQSQSQTPMNSSLREEDLKLLDVLQQLEVGNNNEKSIDLDSSLAPLTQLHQKFELTPELLDKEVVAVATKQPLSDGDSEEENDESTAYTHDFSIALDELDELILKLSQSIQPSSAEPTATNIPQIDGSDDLLRTPVKYIRTTKSANSQKKTPTRSPGSGSKKQRSPIRSPRTPKSSASSRYAPLPLIFTSRSDKKNPAHIASEETVTPTRSNRFSLNIDCNTKSTSGALRKRLAVTELRRKSISVVTEFHDDEGASMPTASIKTPSHRGRRTVTSANFDKTYITCSLTPRRRSERMLKVYNTNKKELSEVEKFQENTEEDLLKLKKANDPAAIMGAISTATIKPITSNPKRLANVVKVDMGSELTKPQSTSAVVLPKSKKAVTRDMTVGVHCKVPVKVMGSFPNVPRNVTKEGSVVFNTVPIVEANCTRNMQKYKIKRVRIRLRRFDAKRCATVANNFKEHGQGLLEIASNSVNVQSTAATVVVAEDNKEEDDEVIACSDNEADSIFHNRNLLKAFKCMRRSFNVGSARKRRRDANESPLAASSGQNVDSHVGADTKIVEVQTTACMRTPETPKLSGYAEEGCEAEDDDAYIQSFYDVSFSERSPAIFSDSSSPGLRSFGIRTTPVLNTENSSACTVVTCPTTPSPVSTPTTSTARDSGSTMSAAERTLIVTPLDLPPTYEEALASCRKFDIHEFEFQNPYYSNPADVTKQKEVGHTVLHIPGNKLNDCPEFESMLGKDVVGLTEWRRKKMLQIGGIAMLQRYRNPQRMREYFASQRRVVMVPQLSAPTRQEAKLWLKARELLRSKEQEASERSVLAGVEVDSPIKVRHQKLTMMLKAEGTNHADGYVDGDIDCSTHSIKLAPFMPDSPLRSSVNCNKPKESSCTPLTTIAKHKTRDSDSFPSSSKLNRQLRNNRQSLQNRLRIAMGAEQSLHERSSRTALKTSQENMVLSSQCSSNDSISNHAVLVALERPSFGQQLQSDSSTNSHELSFGLSSATLDNTFGFKVNLENLQQAKSDIEYNYLTIVTLEVFVPTRDDLYPHPARDEIRCLFYAIEHSVPPACESNCSGSAKRAQLATKACGYIIVNDALDIVTKECKRHGLDADIEVKVVGSEMEALESLLELCALWDPDIYAGYEIEMASWGYVLERAKYLCLNIGPLLSRVPSQKIRDFVDEDKDQFTDLDFEMKLCGRILLDVWRLMRSEIALTSYSFENVTYHILHKRCPWHSFRDLSNWFASPCSRWIVLEYYLERVRGTLALLEQLDLIGRTSEMAKLIGIQFYEVLSRGSQFRVESMMLRIAKPKNLVPLSPSVPQRAHMRAPEYLPLILEPQSRFYADPVIVLDFQSLYPSMIIAYNYCFSTCLGRVEHLGQSTPFEFGASQLRVSPSMLHKLLERDLITISPCGVVFVKSSVREGILPRMLTEILDTRLMVKQSMKLHKCSSALQRILHSRQMGLKLMANVTYGYTAANFSGRMPAVEVGDSVVAKGRETLERAIKMVESNDKWHVKVVYGDTDSMFVLVPGRNREQAFKIGEEIAEAVTQANPQPVKLKLEKVYQPCILQTKKRYVGYMYETPDQVEPVYEAKGIETVRRDGCPAVAKILEKVLRILFETADVSMAKKYVCRQFTKLLTGRANLQDLIFAKEFRGLNGYKPKACVPALELTRKWLQTDPRRIPRSGERVPFIITNGPPGVPLIRLVRSPHEVLADEGFKINAIYYITKAIIPPLNRCLLLIGADVNEWFTNLPRKLLLTPALCTAAELVAVKPTSGAQQQQPKKSTISQYFSTTNCITDCGRQTKQGICAHCAGNYVRTHVTLQLKIAKLERSFQRTQQICQACCGRVGNLNCGSLDCPVLYVLEVKRRKLQQIPYLRTLLLEQF